VSNTKIAKQTPSRTPEQQAAIDARVLKYKPEWAKSHPGIWETIEQPTKDAVSRLSPPSPERAGKMCSMISAFLAWCWRGGIEPNLEAAFQPDLVARYAKSLAKGSRRTIRANLTRWGTTLTRKAPWPPPEDEYERSDPAERYSNAQMKNWLRLVKSQPTKQMSQLLEASILLGTGVGLKGAPASTVKGTHVTRDDRGVFVSVNGRSIPCLAIYEDRLWDLASRCGDSLLVGKPNSVNSTLYRLVDPDLGESISFARLRMTWLFEVLKWAAPMQSVLQAAGIKSAHSIDHLFKLLPQIDENEEIEYLRGVKS